MTPLRRIVVGTDFSSDAERAVARGQALAREHRADLALLHVIDESMLYALKAAIGGAPLMEQKICSLTQSALDAVGAQIDGRDGISVSSAVRVGKVIDELVAVSGDADLLVLGAHGMNRLRDRIIGTTAERLLSRSPIAILVTRRNVTRRYARVLVAVDLSPYSAPAVASALRMAPRARMHVFHVFDVPFEGKLRLADVPDARIQQHRGEVRARATGELNNLVAAILPDESAPLISVERGQPAFRILEAASRYEADLVVVGKQGRSAISEFILGSVTRHVLADAHCDVLVVPTGRGARFPARQPDHSPPPRDS